MKEKIKQNWFLIAIVAIFLVRMFLCSAQNVYYIYGAGYDDYLIASMADNLLSFKWLGTYNELTLSKGIFSSIFLAISNILGMPLLFAEMLFYAISCVFFIHVIKKLIPNKKILIFIYAVLIFNPIMYSKPLLRVYRDNIYSSLLIYLISFMIAIFLNYKENTKSLVKYMVGLGITFAYM